MKVLIVGCGSMGKRRVRCFKANKIDVAHIRGVDNRVDRREEFKKLGVLTFGELSDGLAWAPDMVFCCLPEPLHVDVCIAAVKSGAHFFCEVPLSISSNRLDELAALVKQKELLGAVGGQLPFHPVLQQAKRWLADESFGSPRMILFDYSTYLPGWHPYEKVQDFYEPGHMIALIDLMFSKLWWALDGDLPTDLCCRSSKLSKMDLQGGDATQVQAVTQSGAALTIHLSMFSPEKRNLLRLESETGTIEIDMVNGNVRRKVVDSHEGEFFSVPEDFDFEQTYIDEIAYLLKCVRSEAEWHYPLNRAIHAGHFYETMFQSSESGQWEKVIG